MIKMDKKMEKTKVLLIGNGIYRAFHGEEESWENVLRFVKKEFEKLGMSLNLEPSSKISYSLYFEYLYSVWKKNKGPQANESTAWSSFSYEVAEILKGKYNSPEFAEYAPVVNKMIWNHFDFVLTTNVDNRFEKNGMNLDEGGGSDDDEDDEWEPACNRKWKYSVYRRKESQDGKRKIFYMHGELSKPSSICFGLDHYLGEYMCQYKFLYGMKSNENNTVLDRLHGKKAVIDDDRKNSWLYHFFFNDVDIVGQGLNKDEIDIWWAIEKRFQYRWQRKDKPIEENSVKYFFPSSEKDTNHDKIELLRAMNVCPIVIPCSSYREFYKIYFEDFAGNNCLNDK